MSVASLTFIAKNVVNRIKYFLKVRIPEKFLIAAAYTSNAILIALQYLFFRHIGGESNPVIMATDIVVGAQLLLPFYVMESVPILHYIVLILFIVSGVILRLVDVFPSYYYTVAMITPIVLMKMEPVLTTSPTISKISTRVNRAIRKARLPRSREEALFNLKLSAVYIGGLAISALLYVLKGYIPSLIVAAYNVGIIAFIMLNVATNPMVKIPKEKYSMTLLFVMRYPLLFRLVNRMKMKLHPLIERAGVWIYEVEYLSRYLATFFIYIMILPTLVTTVLVVLPAEVAFVLLPMLAVVPVFLYYGPFISMRSKASKRKQLAEKEYPIFVVYASTMISAGVNLYTVFKELATGKGAELLKGYTAEAKYVTALVERQGIPEATAMERYANTHPSPDVRNFILGYIHQLQLGGKITQYLEQRMVEALDLMRRRMENFVKQIVMLTEIALTVLVLPTLPTVLGFIIAPDIVYNMLFIQMFVITPLMAFMFNSVASAIMPEFRDEYRFTYIPSVVGGVVGLFIGFFMVQQKLLVGVAIVVAGIAIGYYIEYSRQRRVFAEVEKMLPQFFRDLAELRNMMPVAEALKRMSNMNYPKQFTKILKAAVSLRDQGLRFSEQPWHSRSWFWKFTQFIVGKIEEYGGGTPQIFRQLMFFFSEYGNIMYSARSNLKIYEFVIYAIPVIFGMVMYSTLGIFVAMGEVSTPLSGQEMSEVVASLGAQFPQFLRLLKGIDPTVLLICDGIIFEMSLLLGLLSGKVTSGTLKDTKALAIALIVAVLTMLFIPDFVLSFVRQTTAVSELTP
ncbi:MAG: type II secretion system F family protein [Thermofilaceae archaeon]